MNGLYVIVSWALALTSGVFFPPIFILPIYTTYLWLKVRKARKQAASQSVKVLQGKMTDKESFTNGILPCCGGTQFYEGPHGGMNVNIKCANPSCGQDWNVAFAPNRSCIYAEKI